MFPSSTSSPDVHKEPRCQYTQYRKCPNEGDEPGFMDAAAKKKLILNLKRRKKSFLNSKFKVLFLTPEA